jgi:N-acetylmuramoyl-L-alanine amidase
MRTRSAWSTRSTRRPGALATLALLALLAGCAHAPVAPPAPRPSKPTPAPAPAPPRPRPGYEARRDSLETPDTAALAGRRIVLDPGHGGHFPGSMGVNGLSEAAVNLDVALALRDLLVARGAQVAMTRERDRDFLSPADSTTRADLAARMRLANAARPELFVSIHHNADARGSHDVNEIQTYYRSDDDGPSLEAARAVHRALTRNLGIDARRILPGNYFVLRNSEAPAILTESSYLTNPDVEARLALPEKRRLEAEALFLGIAAFFARGAPEVAAFAVTERAGTGTPRLVARIAGAFDHATLTLDGAPLALEVSGDSLSGRPGVALEDGPHTAELRVARAGAGSAPVARLAFDVATPPALLRVDLPRQPDWDGHRPLAVRVRVSDAGGTLHRAPLTVRLRDDGTPHRVAPADTVIEARDGVAWAYLRPAAHAPRTAGTLPLRANVRFAIDAPRVPDATLRLAVRPLAVGAAPRVRAGFVTTEPRGERLLDAPDARDADEVPAWITRDGFAVLPCDSLGQAAVPALRGFRAVAPDSLWPPRMSALFGGALHGRRIALDAEGGGDADGGSGPSGTRASDVNLDVARALAAMLEQCGARVTLVRDGDRALADLDRVRAAEAAGAERYLRIGHRAAPPLLGHWFGSTAGRSWARRTAESLGSLGLPTPPIAEEPQFTLQQASCPALYVSLARVDSAGTEDALRAPGATRAEAYALLVGLAREFAPGATWATDSLVVRDHAGAPVAGAAVRFGRALMLESDARGVVRFVRGEPGPLEAEMLDSRLQGGRILIDSVRGDVLTGPPAR